MPASDPSLGTIAQLWQLAARAPSLHEALADAERLLGLPAESMAILALNQAERSVRRLPRSASPDARGRSAPRVGDDGASEGITLAPSALAALARWFDRGRWSDMTLGHEPAELVPLAAALRGARRFVPGARVEAAPIGGSVESPRHAIAIAVTGHASSLPLAELLAISSAILAREREHTELLRLRLSADAAQNARRSRTTRSSGGDDIIGTGTGLRRVFERIELAARADVPVLILGETGAGKEVLARAVHERSDRRERPFVRVNCGAIPPDLIDSELFGHERGAFTGATDMRRGWFEQADGGTLFLDEIGELPLPAQVRLLRVLQDGTLHRVGGQKPLRVDVRIVAATHRDLPALVQQRDFREDLWYRIAVFPVLLPPLRDRVEDIPQLAEHFARRAANRFGLHQVPIAASDMSLLAAYRWPGNVRELASVIDRAVILGGGRTIEIAVALGAEPTRPSANAARLAEPRTEEIDSLDEAIRRHIARALERTHGRIEGPRGAAALLAINPHTLRAKMRKLGIRWSAYRD
jgi:transcriptional regulator with GAF, ATPase, and Fis domain